MSATSGFFPNDLWLLAAVFRAMAEYLSSSVCVSLMPRLREVASELSSAAEDLMVELAPVETAAESVDLADKLVKVVNGEMPCDDTDAAAALRNLKEGNMYELPNVNRLYIIVNDVQSR